MANFKKPSWFINLKLQHVSGQFKKPSWFQDKTLTKPTGKFNTGNFQEQSLTSRFSAGGTTPGHMQTRDVAKPTGAFNKGGYQDQAATTRSAFPGGATDVDPYGNYYFSLEINDGSKSTIVAHFQECSGLKNSTTPFEIEEGGMNTKSHKRPGQGKWENLVLKYASSASTFLLEWRDDWISGTDNWQKRVKYSGAVSLISNERKVVKRYSFKNAWPVSWEGPAFSSGDSSLAVETLEIAHDGLVIDDDDTPFQS